MANAPFHDNVVILTGASQGIGEQLAYQLADQGAKLVLAARNADKLEAVTAGCRGRGAEAIAVQTDVTDEAQCRQLIERAVATYGRIDTLLNNAGKGWPRRFENLPDVAHLHNEMNLNYFGLVYCVHYALPHLKQTRGRIIGVGSFGGLVGLPGTIGYNSSKHAMRGFLNTLRAELVGTGVTVTLVFPGAISGESLEATMGENVRNIPTMTPERCAELILRAGGNRQRQHILTAQGRILFWLSLLIPGILDRQLNRLSHLYRQ
ncbi:MAG: SDR family oxidoreductase [Anaerolineae bacterium]|nr:SDR family oxidoreductase [Anaerolineae bacterium]